MNKIFVEAYGIVTQDKGNEIYVDFGDVSVWLPKYKLEKYPIVGSSGDVVMPEWLAKEKKIIGE